MWLQIIFLFSWIQNSVDNVTVGAYNRTNTCLYHMPILRIGRKCWTHYRTTRGNNECIPCIATSPRSVVPGTIHDNKCTGIRDPDSISRVRLWNRHLFEGPERMLQCHPLFLPMTHYLRKLLPAVLPLEAPLLPTPRNLTFSARVSLYCDPVSNWDAPDDFAVLARPLEWVIMFRHKIRNTTPVL